MDMNIEFKNVIVPFGVYTSLNSNLDIEIFQYTARNKDSGVVKFRVHTPGHRLVESRIAKLFKYDSEYHYYTFKYLNQTITFKINR